MTPPFEFPELFSRQLDEDPDQSPLPLIAALAGAATGVVLFALEARYSTDLDLGAKSLLLRWQSCFPSVRMRLVRIITGLVVSGRVGSWHWRRSWRR